MVHEKQNEIFIQSNTYRLVGKLTKAHGLKGEIILHIFSGSQDWLKLEMELCLILPNQKSPQFKKIKNFRWQNNLCSISFDDIIDRTQAESMTGTFVYINKSLLQTNSQTDFYLIEIEGFNIIDETLGNIGKIKGFSSNGPQDILQVQGKYNCLVPLIQPFLIKIDYKNKEVHMRLPEGLVEVHSEDSREESQDE